MKSFGFTLITLIIIGVLVAGGYFAIIGLKDPAGYIAENTPTVGDLRSVESDPETGNGARQIATESPKDPVTDNTQPSSSESVNNDLATQLQKLLDAKTVLKVGSKGPAVGYVQQFMNLYFKKNLKIDNDFGKTLETNVKTFQKAVGLPQTGQVGTQGLTKMIEWLNKNS